MRQIPLLLVALFCAAAPALSKIPEPWDGTYEAKASPEADGWSARMSGADAFAKVVPGGLDINTIGSHLTPHWSRSIPFQIDPGFTLEWRTRIIRTEAGDGGGGSIFALRFDSGGKPKMIAVFMGETYIALNAQRKEQLTGAGMHTYRLTVDRGGCKLYMDGRLFSEAPLPDGVAEAREASLQFGDHSPRDNAHYLVESIRWSGQGAFTPHPSPGAIDTADSKALWASDTRPLLALPLPGTLLKKSAPRAGKDYAVSGTGFFDIRTGEYAALQSRYFLHAGPDALHIAIESPLPRKPVATAQRRDDIRVATDDSIEIFLSPQVGAEPIYQIIINTEGQIYDQRNSDPAWNIEAVEVDNHIENSLWTVRVSIPYRSLGLSKPKADSLWLLNLCRTFGGESLVQTSMVPLRHTYLAPHQFAYLRFLPESAAINLKSTGNLFVGKAEVELAIDHAPAGTTIAAILSGPDGVIAEEKETTEGVSASLALAHDGLPQTGALHLAVESQKAGLLYRMQFPFAATKEPYEIAYTYVDAARENLIVGIGIPEFRRQQGGLEMEVRLLQKGTRIAHATPTVAPVAEARFPLNELAAGDYDIEVQIQDRAEGALLHDSFRNYAKAAPDWQGNGIGISDKVPAPWTPVHREGDTVSLWNREIAFSGEGLFPTVIQSAGEDLLSAPMELVGRVDGKPVRFQASEHRWSGIAEDRVQREAQGSAAGVTVRTTTRVEFDGLIWIDVELESPHAISLDELVLNLPMPLRAATLRNFGDYRMERTGTLPQGASAKNLTERPIFWLGNEKAGIQWFAETLKGWRLAQPEQSLIVTRDEQQVVAALRVIDAPIELNGKRRFSFGLMVTPVKPPRSERRSWRFRATESNLFYTINPWFTEWTKLFNYPDRKELVPEKLKALEGLRAQGTRVLPYLSLGPTSPYTPEFKYFGEEWRRSPFTRVVKTTALDPQWHIWANRMVCNQSESYRDFFVSKVAEALKEVEVDGFYFDFGTSRTCDNPLHGCGWTDEEGRKHPTFNALGTRELARRLYRVIRSHRPDSIILHHMSGETDMSVHPYADMLINGENFTGALMMAPNYYHALPFDKFRAELLSHPRGPEEVLLPQFKRSMGVVSPERVGLFDTPEGEAMIDHLLGLGMLHDTMIWPIWGVKPDKLWAVQDEFGWDENVVFHPYWEADRFIEEISPQRADLAVSAYRRQGREMLVLMNNSDEPVTVRLRLRSDWLGRSDGELEDRYHPGGARYLMRNSTLEVPLEARMFRLLLPHSSSKP